MDHTSMYYKEVSQKTERQIIQTTPIRRQVADLPQVKLWAKAKPMADGL